MAEQIICDHAEFFDACERCAHAGNHDGTKNGIPAYCEEKRHCDRGIDISVRCSRA